MPSPTLPKYIPHIDGLRAIAVLSVLVYHAGLPLPGGYLGVDIFFVISGFLITRLLRNELLATGRIEYRAFYLRRIRRLLPASFAMLAATAAGSAVLLAPHDFVAFAKSMIAAIFSASNILFFLESGYFSAASELKPLLHTWSLSVEEQYYLLWPFLLFWVFRRWGDRGALVLTVALIAGGIALNLAASFEPIVGIAGIGERAFGEEVRSAMFYLLPFRAYELGIGALLVWLMEFNRPSGPIRSALCAAGFAAISASLLYFTAETPIPSYYALLPCFGAAALIYAGDAPFLGRVLTNPISAGIGQISYSLYLVHWPIIALYTYWALDLPALPDSLILIAVSIGLAIALYMLIEKPCRVTTAVDYRAMASSRITRHLAGGAVALVALGAGIGSFDGWAWRLSPLRKQTYLAIKDPALFNVEYYGGRGCRVSGPLNSCELNPTSRKAIRLIGNSHARHYIAGILREFPDRRLIFFDNRCQFNTLDLCYAGRWQELRFSCDPGPAIRRDRQGSVSRHTGSSMVLLRATEILRSGVRLDGRVRRYGRVCEVSGDTPRRCQKDPPGQAIHRAWSSQRIWRSG